MEGNMGNKINYLTEDRLADELKIIFPHHTFIRDKSIKEVHRRYRPDFHCEALKLIVEFDGDRHYTNPQIDSTKDQLYAQHGWKTIRIPYFVQLSAEVIKDLFNIDINFIQYFPHGFVTTITLPSYFCEMGVNKFKKDLERFAYIKNDIIKSLKDKLAKLKNIDLVLPTTLQDIL
jgi:hypothetical protein